MRTITPAGRLIVALDFDREDDALRTAECLAGDVGWFKVGLQLYTRGGPACLKRLSAIGPGLFLDLKLHDIPNTVACAVSAAFDLGAGFLTVHIAGGSEMIRAAVQARGSAFAGEPAGADPGRMLLGVTVLSSLDDPALAEVGVPGSVAEQVCRLAGLALRSGLHGLVAGGREIAQVRSAFGDGPILVAPGIRPAGAPRHDQARVLTPAEAIRLGADYIVVGRPITGSADPRATARRIADEVARVSG